jgi:peptidoglycan hydrolase-like protein with peptidoglycan-binding domain
MSTGDPTIIQTQTYLMTLGFNPGTIDGKWGKNSQDALDALKNSTVDQSHKYGVTKICWGVKFGTSEIDRLVQMIKNLGMAPITIHDFMACMAWETGEQFSPATKSPVSTATGLIQFMKATATGLGTTVEALAAMTVVQQLDYVEKYFKPYKGKLNNLGDIYMAIIWPAGIGKPDSYVMWKTGDAPFEPNSGLDLNKDGQILRIECLHKVNNKYVKGFLNGNTKAA